ncbi:MAG: hypothetical protein EXQ56_10150 [Acidobacteria bacterium]|nr:hypothetical protein [Acidobacteriota bacterium]
MELAGGVLLLAGIYVWLGAFLLGSLLAAFIVALVVNLLRGHRNLDCQCFGRRTVRIGWGHVAHNTLMLAVSLLIGIVALRANPALSWGNPASASLTILAAVYTAVLSPGRARAAERAGQIAADGESHQNPIGPWKLIYWHRTSPYGLSSLFRRC